MHRYALDYRCGSSGNIARLIYNVYTAIGKRIWPVISTDVLKLKDYSRSQATGSHVQGKLVSRKRCNPGCNGETSIVTGSDFQ